MALYNLYPTEGPTDPPNQVASKPVGFPRRHAGALEPKDVTSPKQSQELRGDKGQAKRNPTNSTSTATSLLVAKPLQKIHRSHEICGRNTDAVGRNGAGDAGTRVDASVRNDQLVPVHVAQSGEDALEVSGRLGFAASWHGEMEMAFGLIFFFSTK